MNKIISINLKGLVFQVEEEAFEHLQKYLELLNQHFANEESRLEIIDDIESRIAEMLQEKLKTKAAITAADIDEIIGIMGKPADFGIDTEEDETEEPKEKKANYDVPPNTTTHKRFMRDTENSIMGGVCAGAGHYFSIEPLWIRLIFLFLFFVMGTGFVFYLILWVIIPEAKTPTDRLQMKGEPVNIDTIEKTVKEEYERVKENLNNFGKDKKDPFVRGVYKVGGIARDILLGAAKVLSKIIGIFFLITGLLLLITLAGILIKLSVDGTLPLLSLAFESSAEFWITVTAGAVLLLTLVIGLISAAINLFNPSKKILNKGVGISLGVLSVIAFFALVTMGISFGSSFSQKESIKTNRYLPVGDTLTVTAFNPLYHSIFGNYDASQTHSYRSANFNFLRMDFDYVKTSSMAIKNDSLWCMAKFEVQSSNDSIWELEIIRTANGRDDYMAQVYAERIPLGAVLNDSLLTLTTHFYIGEDVPFRNQQITYRLWVPHGKVVKFEQGVTEIMQRGLKRRVTDPHRYGMVWEMGENGLRCLDCKSLKGSSRELKNTRYYNESDFTDIEINIPAEVNIEQGADYEIYVSGSDQMRNRVDIFKTGDKLVVDVEDGLFDIFDDYNGGNLVITIKTPNLEYLEANGAAKVYLSGINNPKLKIEASGASIVEGDINVTQLDVELNGSAGARLNGRALDVGIDISGAARLSAYDLLIDNCDVESSGASNAEVYIQQRLSADASGASNIKYKGSPVVKSSTSGAANVKQIK